MRAWMDMVGLGKRKVKPEPGQKVCRAFHTKAEQVQWCGGMKLDSPERKHQVWEGNLVLW